MKVYILTSEPYHDNSQILGVYDDEGQAVAAWKGTPDPTDINGEDVQLTEWNLDTNSQCRVWYAKGEQVSDQTAKGWLPIRCNYTFQFPDGTPHPSLQGASKCQVNSRIA